MTNTYIDAINMNSDACASAASTLSTESCPQKCVKCLNMVTWGKRQDTVQSMYNGLKVLPSFPADEVFS